jgi:hypothetical protein
MTMRINGSMVQRRRGTKVKSFKGAKACMHLSAG